MEKIKSLLITSLFLFLIYAQVHAAAIEGLIKNAPSAKPGQDALVVRRDSRVVHTAPGKSSTETQFAVKIFNKAGREKFSDIPIFIDKKMSEFTLLKAGTFLKNGSFEPLEDKGINEVTTPALSQSLMYGDFVNKVYSFSSAEPGNTLYMNYREEDRLEEGYLSGLYCAKESTDIAGTNFTVSIPSSETLKWKSGYKVDYSEKDGYKNYSVESGYTGKIVPEPNMPSREELFDCFLYTTARDWKHAVGFFRDYIMDAAIADATVKAKALQLTNEAKTDEDKILSITKFINKDINDIALSLGLGSYKPNQAAVVLKNGYGDQKDKTVLFIAMLKACNIESRPALLKSNYAPIQMDVPTIQQFTDVVPAVRNSNGSWGIIDTAMSVNRTGYINIRSNSKMLLLDDNISLLPQTPYIKIPDKCTGTISGVLDNKGNLKASIDLQASGLYDRQARGQLLGLKNQTLAMYYDSIADGFYTGTSVRSYKNTDPENYSKDIDISMNIDSSDFAVTQGDFMMLNITPPPFRFAGIPYNTSAPSRTWPYVLGSDKFLEYTFKIKLPAGYEPIYMPETKEFRDAYGTFNIVCDYNAKENMLTFTRRMEIKTGVIPADKYQSLKTAVETISNQSSKLVLLSKVK